MGRFREVHPTQMYQLINELLTLNYNKYFYVQQSFGGYPQVIFLDHKKNMIGDAICHAGSYGHEDGLLEISGLDITEDEYGDTVLGYLTAAKVIEHLEATLAKVSILEMEEVDAPKE